MGRERGVPAEEKLTSIEKPLTTEQNPTIKGMLEENTGGGKVNVTFPVPSDLCGFDGVFLLVAKRSKPVGRMENREWEIKHRRVMGGTGKPRQVSGGD